MTQETDGGQGKKCPECGTVNRMESRYCWECGAELATATMAPVLRTNAAQGRGTSRRSLLVVCAVGAVVGIVVVLAGWYAWDRGLLRYRPSDDGHEVAAKTTPAGNADQSDSKSKPTQVESYSAPQTKGPGYTAAEMAVTMNPHLETLSSDDSEGTITVRDKKTGKTMTFKFDPDKKIMVVTDENGKEATVKVVGDNAKSAVEVQSSAGSAKPDGTGSNQITVGGSGGGTEGIGASIEKGLNEANHNADGTKPNLGASAEVLRPGGVLGGGAYRIGSGVSAPSVLSKVEPSYTEEARRARVQGTVVLSLVVDEQGYAQNLKVLRSLDIGLDQRAIEAVQKWRFKPGMKDGKPVPVMATIEVNFRLV